MLSHPSRAPPAGGYILLVGCRLSQPYQIFTTSPNSAHLSQEIITELNQISAELDRAPMLTELYEHSAYGLAVYREDFGP
ncbi:hypothetical protein AArcCO_4095 (plasmid) [Halalkaliarchaeum sp. AArc-CO]|nr:hypothetical protein AArcCO_4095 [Halalkaliarchaeum sp. AArc-CO]